MTEKQDSSWTRALMASSGIAFGHQDGPHHASPEWREASAADTPVARLHKLGQLRDPEVREVVARRPDCPMGLLASLAHDRSVDVRIAVAGNPRITPAVAEHMATDRDPSVLKALARNASVSMQVLQQLALHRKEDVRRVASRQFDERMHGQDAQHVDEASQADLSGQAQEPLARGLPWEIRDRVIPFHERPATP